MATQKGRNWSSGDIVTAANLSSVERGVNTLAEDYTPTTWANGDTVTAAALNNIEQGIVDGSSSDFNTAQLIYSGIGQVALPTIHISRIYDDGVNKGTAAAISDAGTYDVVLYNGVAYGYADNILDSVLVDGAIEYDDGDITITGDCTITISHSSTK